MNNFNRHLRVCILLAGPSGNTFNKQDVLKMEAALVKQGAAVVCIADGENALTCQHLARVFKLVTDCHRPFVFIMAHGGIKLGIHYIQLTNSLMKITTFL